MSVAGKANKNFGWWRELQNGLQMLGKLKNKQSTAEM